MAPVEDVTTKPDPSSTKEFSDKEKLDPVRPQVAIQWGLKGIKGKTPEPQASVKKAMPFVGKMPRKRENTNRDSSSPAKSKFGPLSANNVPPPGVVTNANPTPPPPQKPQPPPPTTFSVAPTYQQPPPPVSVSQLGGKRAPKNPTPKNDHGNSLAPLASSSRSRPRRHERYKTTQNANTSASQGEN